MVNASHSINPLEVFAHWVSISCPFWFKLLHINLIKFLPEKKRRRIRYVCKLLYQIKCVGAGFDPKNLNLWIALTSFFISSESFFIQSFIKNPQTTSHIFDTYYFCYRWCESTFFGSEISPKSILFPPSLFYRCMSLKKVVPQSMK